jgi:hypothetical protein
MRVFEKTRESGWGNRLNVVDENNVVVGYDYESSCCERFGYYFTKKKPDKLDDEPIDEGSFDHSGYVFDTSYEEAVPLSGGYDEGGATSFKLTKTGEPDLFLVLYNHHNGYYSHGFDMTKDDEEFKSGSI